MNKPALVTTIDNPFNPFTQEEDWYKFDVSHGYNTQAYLARVTIDSDELPPAREVEAINKACDDIVKYNINGLYIKVYEDTIIEPMDISHIYGSNIT